MNLIITNQVKTKTPKNKYEIILEFSETKTKILYEEKEKIINWIKLFKEYKNKLEEDWNSWCNVEIESVISVSEEFSLGFKEDIILDLWKDHPDYDMLDIPEKIKVFYYNEFGVKFNVRIEDD